MSAGEETEKDKSRGRRGSRSLLTMALACLGLGCAPVSSKGTVYKTVIYSAGLLLMKVLH